MNRIRKFSSVILLGILFSRMLSACEHCGGFFGITPIDNYNFFSLSHRYSVYNGYPFLDQSGTAFPAGAYRYAVPPSVLHTNHAAPVMTEKDFESYKTIDICGRYFISERIHLDAHIPVVNNKTKSLIGEADVWGLGDITLTAGFVVLRTVQESPYRHRLTLGLGIKFPTGGNDATYDDGDRLPSALQPGTGSTDLLSVLVYTSAWKKWMFGLRGKFRYSFSNSHHERSAPVTSNTFSVGRIAEKNEWMFYPQLQVRQEYSKGWTQYGYTVSGTKLNRVMAGPGCEIYYKHIGLNAAVLFPLHQYVYEMNMQMKAYFVVNLFYAYTAR